MDPCREFAAKGIGCVNQQTLAGSGTGIASSYCREEMQISSRIGEDAAARLRALVHVHIGEPGEPHQTPIKILELSEHEAPWPGGASFKLQALVLIFGNDIFLGLGLIHE